ncbi:MAG: hypothetical protein KBA30_06975 [Clostridia bacterium]|nr:hypothetical protein [Clostridia bacterium]
MRIIFNEIRRSLRRTPHIALLFTLVFSLSIALLFLVSIELQNARYDKRLILNAVSGTNICMVGLHADESMQEQIRAHPETMDSLMRFRQDLLMTEGIRVLNSNIVNANAGEEWPELPDSFFLSNLSYGTPIPNAPEGFVYRPLDFVMVSENYTGFYGLTLAAGRPLSGDSFSYRQDKPVEILLGAAFMPYYSVGDRIPYSFGEEELTLEVAGILSPGSKTTTGGTGFDSLDDQVLFPLFTDIDPAAHAYDTFRRFFYQLLASPTLIVEDPNLDISERVQELATLYGGFEVDLGYISYKNASMVLSFTGQQADLTTAMTAVALLVVLVTTAVLLSVRIRGQLRAYAIYLLTGRSPWGICGMVLAEMVLLLLAASGLSLLIVRPIFFGRFPWDWSYQLPRLLRGAGVLLCFITAQTVYGMRKLKNASLIRRGNT